MTSDRERSVQFSQMTATEDILNNVSSRVHTPPPPLPQEAYLAMGVYLVILGGVAFCGNFTVLLVIVCQKKALMKLLNILLVNMALVDLLVTITAYPITAIACFHGRWVFGEVMCWVSGFFVFSLRMVSMNTLTFIAVFRYILVCRPSLHHLLRLQTAKPVLIASWVHAVFWTALPLFGWNSYVPEPFLTSCTIQWAAETLLSKSYIVLTVFTCYLLPVSVVVFCYTSILHKSRKLTFGARKNSSMVRLEEVLWHHKVKTERRVTKVNCVSWGSAWVFEGV
ncbi:hypothetical protein BaRGS_00011583 [Batillaria attramentaria]|uniref:G-protein coupled receptors family 1 profile domain-containing protein n=1 Tax=Batillaria attramentaria TaxID=370345 RepID=A0ABD0LE44_9CAEN